jgi:hypothetical protein
MKEQRNDEMSNYQCEGRLIAKYGGDAKLQKVEKATVKSLPRIYCQSNASILMISVSENFLLESDIFFLHLRDLSLPNTRYL